MTFLYVVLKTCKLVGNENNSWIKLILAYHWIKYSFLVNYFFHLVVHLFLVSIPYLYICRGGAFSCSLEKMSRFLHVFSFFKKFFFILNTTLQLISLSVVNLLLEARWFEFPYDGSEKLVLTLVSFLNPGFFVGNTLSKMGFYIFGQSNYFFNYLLLLFINLYVL